MDLNYLRRLVKVFDDSKATHLEIEEDGVRISLALEHATVEQIHSSPVHLPYQTFNQPAPVHEIQAPAIAEDKKPESNTKVSVNTVNLHTVTSPIVGTFYRSPSPESGPFVEIGSRVKQGDTLCIIEAMKLMNEIESDAGGIIENILVENSKPVEFNQPIFVIRPD